MDHNSTEYGGQTRQYIEATRQLINQRNNDARPFTQLHTEQYQAQINFSLRKQVER